MRNWRKQKLNSWLKAKTQSDKSQLIFCGFLSYTKLLIKAEMCLLIDTQLHRYDGKWRDADPEVVQKMLEDGVPHTYRFKIPKGEVITINDKVRGTVSWDAEATLGDFILLRSTGIPVYNFCVAVDDALMGITTVVRAEEHLTNTVRQVLILKALGYTPPEYAHLSLILGQVPITVNQSMSKQHPVIRKCYLRTKFKMMFSHS